jgi:enoyl-CoA hydratase/carnithine racemase
MRFPVRGDGGYLLGLPEVKLGIIPGNGGSQRLSRIVGVGKALELCVTGENIGPQEAYHIGLLNRLFPAAGLARETEAFASCLAEGAPLAIAALKRCVGKGAELTLPEGLPLEAALVETLYDTEDAAEGFRAFREKRPPVYKGR